MGFLMGGAPSPPSIPAAPPSAAPPTVANPQIASAAAMQRSRAAAAAAANGGNGNPDLAASPQTAKPTLLGAS